MTVAGALSRTKMTFGKLPYSYCTLAFVTVPQGAAHLTKDMQMTDVLSLKPRGLVRGRPFANGPSNRPAERRAGSGNKRTLAAAVLLEGEAVTSALAPGTSLLSARL